MTPSQRAGGGKEKGERGLFNKVLRLPGPGQGGGREKGEGKVWLF